MLRHCDQLEVVQSVIEGVVIDVVNEPTLRDRAVDLFPHDAGAIAKAAVRTLHLDMAIGDTDVTDGLAVMGGAATSQSAQVEAIGLALVALTVLAQSILGVWNSEKGLAYPFL